MIKRIIVEPGSYGCRNMGDVAMMEVAVSRLSELWPSAEIEILTDCPDLLSRFCPSTDPLEVDARSVWLSGRSILGHYRRSFPQPLSTFLQGMEEQLWLRCPKVSEMGVNLRAKVRRRTLAALPSEYRRQLTGADLLVISGMGGLNDAFADSACPLLDEIEFVLRAGIPVVAFGQGIGPITEPVLLAKARATLPHLKLIALREGLAGLPLLESLGVPRERICVTGDDAIELAYQHKPPSCGKAIGVNLRLADYAGTDERTVVRLREPLRLAARALNASLVSVPISFDDNDSDVSSYGKLLNDQLPASPAKIQSPEDVIRRVGDCRAVVTGSYHGGVFALAQGIPVVGLVQSDYYEQKFAGLRQQFPGGCRMIDFRKPVSSGEIQDAIRSAWESAKEVREPLLRAAAGQIESGRAAYRLARELCTPGL